MTAFDNFLADLKEQPWVEAWNSNMFLRLFLNPVILVQSLPIVLRRLHVAPDRACGVSAGNSLWLCLVSHAHFQVAHPSLSCRHLCEYQSAVRRRSCRSTSRFGLPLAGVKVDDYVLGVIACGLMNSSAYLREIFRAGIQSIPKGQNEAARSLGMNAFQTLLYVMIPQTFRNVPPYADQ